MAADPIPRLTSENTALIVVDLQDRLLGAMTGGEAVIEASCRMIRAAGLLQVPVIVTEQYPQGLGHTCAAVREAIADPSAAPVEKLRFTACVEEVLHRLESLKRSSVIVVGIEAHVCLQQTVLDLLRAGYQPYVCVDAVTSRREIDRSTAIERMRGAGAIITTTESVIFELLDRAGTEQFKQILKIVK